MNIEKTINFFEKREKMNKEKAINLFKKRIKEVRIVLEYWKKINYTSDFIKENLESMKKVEKAYEIAIKALENERPKGIWIRMSNLSEKEDDRYKCSNCGNVVHYKDKMNLYTFNSWCGRCGSDNGRKMEKDKLQIEVEE